MDEEKKNLEPETATVEEIPAEVVEASEIHLDEEAAPETKEPNKKRGFWCL